MVLHTLPQVLLCFSNISSFLISKDICLVSLKLLTRPFICRAWYATAKYSHHLWNLRKHSISVFIFPIDKRFRYYYFINVYIIYMYWIFNRIKNYLFNFIATEFQKFLYHHLYHTREKNKTLQERGPWGFLLPQYFCQCDNILIQLK